MYSGHKKKLGLAVVQEKKKIHPHNPTKIFLSGACCQLVSGPGGLHHCPWNFKGEGIASILSHLGKIVDENRALRMWE